MVHWVVGIGGAVWVVVPLAVFVDVLESGASLGEGFVARSALSSSV